MIYFFKGEHILNCFTYSQLLQLAMQVIRTGSAGADQESFNDTDNTIKTQDTMTTE